MVLINFVHVQLVSDQIGKDAKIQATGVKNWYVSTSNPVYNVIATEMDLMIKILVDNPVYCNDFYNQYYVIYQRFRIMEECICVSTMYL